MIKEIASLAVVGLIGFGAISANGTVLIVVRQGNTITFGTNSNESTQDDGKWRALGESCKVLNKRNILVLHSGLSEIRRTGGAAIGNIPLAIQNSLAPTMSLRENETRIVHAVEEQYKYMQQENIKNLTPEQKSHVGGVDRIEGQLLVMAGFDAKGTPKFDFFGVDVSVVGLKQYFYVGHWELEDLADRDFAVLIDSGSFIPVPWNYPPSETVERITKLIETHAAKEEALYGGRVVIGQLTHGKSINWISNGEICSDPGRLPDQETTPAKTVQRLP